ncbi:MAG: hypothetical protein PVF58_00340 [Candidatus Methanofastidiosia archaeon]|jgi:hypothetical protein
MYWFTNIFAAIFTGILLFIGQKGFNGQINPGSILLLSLFGIALSVIGFFMVIAFTLGHQNYIMNVVVILYCLEKSEFYRNWEKPVHYKMWHRLFFEITIALFVALSLYNGYQVWEPLIIFHHNPHWLIVLFVIFFGFIEGLFHWRWQGEFDKRKEVIKALFPRFKIKIDDPIREANDIKKRIAKICYQERNPN